MPLICKQDYRWEGPHFSPSLLGSLKYKQYFKALKALWFFWRVHLQWLLQENIAQLKSSFFLHFILKKILTPPHPPSANNGSNFLLHSVLWTGWLLILFLWYDIWNFRYPPKSGSFLDSSCLCVWHTGFPQRLTPAKMKPCSFQKRGNNEN